MTKAFKSGKKEEESCKDLLIRGNVARKTKPEFVYTVYMGAVKVTPLAFHLN